MDEQGGLLADHFHDARMRVTQRVDADAGDEIEVARAIHIVDVTAFATMHHQRIAAIVLKQVLAFEIDYGIGAR